jgi:hypothetical protein
MRQFLILILGILTSVSVLYSQTVTHAENFDGNSMKFTPSPATAWKIDTNYYVNTPNSIRGIVPNLSGNSIVLTSPIYDLSDYNYVYLRFNHICKVSPMDAIRIEYKRKSMTWQPIPAYTYKGEAANYFLKGFSAESYPEWETKDSTKMPEQSWWREELFDVSIEVQADDEVQFRFVLTRGNTSGTQISYGWLIDDINIIAAPYELKNPVVEFTSPWINDTVYTAGPHTVRAKVKTQSIYSLQTPWLAYTSTLNGISVSDSILMTAIAGDTIWEGNIPQFVAGTSVHYSITGKDMQGNYTYIDSNYLIVKPPHGYGDTSIALVSIDSPVRGQTVGNTSIPVIVSIRNQGDSTLTSATIHWKVNDVEYPPCIWTCDLAWDIMDTAHIGNYISRENTYDTIQVWISSSVLSSDTLTLISYGCADTMAGNYTVGSNGTFSSVNSFLNVLKDCSPVGDITLLLEKGTYDEFWDFGNLSNLMGNYTLTVTSADANADSVILRPQNTVPGITLRKTHNLILKAITVDAATHGQHAILFADSCSNIVIRDCKLLADPTTTAMSSAPIYKGLQETGVVDNIFIINNLLDGGGYGILFYGGTTARYGANIVFDSNRVSNHYQKGIDVYYTNFTSCSYNTVLSRTGTTYIYATWYGIDIAYCNGPFIGNKIIQRTTGITSPFGIRVEAYNLSNTTDTGLIANNEIMVSTTSANYGIYLSGVSRAKILHNSVYVGGTGAGRGIHLQTNYGTPEWYSIKNNHYWPTKVGIIF